MDQEASPRRERLAGLPKPAQWALLAALSVAVAALLELARLPAALLVGPMIVAIALGINGVSVRPHRWLNLGAQAIVGCLIARSIEPEIFVSFLEEWPVFLGAILATLFASAFLGYMISRWRVLPGTTAVWGSTPGAASAMVVMADAFSADSRLVAFMQYFRVILVSLAAALIARFTLETDAVAAPSPGLFPDVDWLALAETLAVAIVGVLLAWLTRLPAGTFLLPMALGATLHLTGFMDIELPPLLLAASYFVLGWAIGLNFTRPILLHAARALPQIVVATMLLIGFCAALGLAMSRALGLDPLTAYLATSPGGIDAVAIIAAASDNVNLSVVMAMQTARVLIVLAAGPPLARLVARWVKD
ncbi:MAG: AbrB family transcriptional regulator [Sphingomonadaceae bacterium]